MQSPEGVFIVLEGSDGSGKSTQFELLKKRLTDAGYSTEVFDFPRYDKPSSHFVRRYLNGDYGPATSINPYTASLFFALDRFEAAADIRAALEAGKVVLSNRYVGSNMAHQGAKFDEPIEKRSFFVWEDSLEFQLLNIPRPNISLFLRVPAETSYELIKQKAARSYTERTHDEHEGDIEHLRKSVETYDLLCKLFPKDFKTIDCAPNGEILSIEAINSKIWEAISTYLPHIAKKETPVEPKEETTAEEPSQPSTLPAQDVDFFEWEVDKLSLHAIIELVKLGLSVSPRWDSGWRGEGSRYSYLIPEGLPSDAAAAYDDSYKQIAKSHQEVYKALAQNLINAGRSKNQANTQAEVVVRRLIPMGAYFKSVIRLEKDEAAAVIAKTKSSSLPEIASFSHALTKQALNIWPNIKITDSDSGDGATPKAINEILAELGNQKLPQNLASTEPVKLLEASPKNEFDLLADGLYSFSNLSRSEILTAIEKWNYQQKSDALTSALSANPQILEAAVYRFDALSDRPTLLELIRHARPASYKIQQPTVRYGYTIEPLVEEAHLEDKFTDAFDMFLGLFTQLQSLEGRVSDYATLAGHQVRWQGSLNASNLAQLKKVGPLANVDGLVAAAAEAHPIVGEYLTSEKQPAAPKKSNRPRRRRGGKTKKQQ